MSVILATGKQERSCAPSELPIRECRPLRHDIYDVRFPSEEEHSPLYFDKPSKWSQYTVSGNHQRPPTMRPDMEDPR